MNPARPFPWVDAAILGFSAWRSFPGLLEAWRHAPYDRLGWIAFLLWIAPLVWRFSQPPRPWFAGHPACSWLALLLLLGGSLADINALKYGALAVALAGFQPRLLLTVPWLLLGVAWMPALGWLGAPLGTAGMHGLRLLLGCLALGVGLQLSRSHPTPPPSA
jgi:hypothetical protein